MAYGKNGATCCLAGAVRTLQKRVEWLEARAQHAAAPAPVVEHIVQAPARYTLHALVMDYISPKPLVFTAPAPVEEYISPAPAVYATKVLFRNTFLQNLLCMPYQLLWWSTSLQRQRQATLR